MRALIGWRVHRRRDPIGFDITDPQGSLAARVTPLDGRWNGLWKRMGLLGRLEAAERHSWEAAGGSVPIHRWVVVELADGQSFRTCNGRPHGPLRRAGNAYATVRGRRYAFRHLSGAGAEIRRDGRRLAGAWLGGRHTPPDAQRAGFGIGVDLRIEAPLDHTDELMIVLFLDLFGPPGREGAISRVAKGAWDDFLAR
jgi:hypothetical protein